MLVDLDALGEILGGEHLDGRPPGVALDERVDRHEMAAEDRIVGERDATHAGPLRAVAAEDERDVGLGGDGRPAHDLVAGCAGGERVEPGLEIADDHGALGEQFAMVGEGGADVAGVCVGSRDDGGKPLRAVDERRLRCARSQFRRAATACRHSERGR